MTTNGVKHLITGHELNQYEIQGLLGLAEQLKADRSLYSDALSGQHIAILFEKPSLRTRLSFSVAINQLGGQIVESISQTRKKEEPKDLIRVVQGYCSAMMIRTFDTDDLMEMAHYASIPIINGLTDLFHPCQILADLMTLKENFGTVEDLKICYIGDGNNILHSLMIMATKLGITVNYCCPSGHEPKYSIWEYVENKEKVKVFTDPKEAVTECHAIYADVWSSMGSKPSKESDFDGYQVNEELMSYALPNSIFMHCMPMNRGREVSDDLPDTNRSVIFQQSENRLHVQKSLLIHLLN